MNIILLIIIGISLSMDAFSFALSLGTFNISRKKSLIYAIMVGIFHFFMPLIGLLLGNSLQSIISINSNKLIFVIFLFIAIEMLISLFSKEDKEYSFSFLSMLLYAFSVSMDSLTLGIGLNSLTTSPLLAFILFSIESFSFTYAGLLLGRYSYQRFGKTSKVIGFIIMSFLAFMHLFK